MNSDAHDNPTVILDGKTFEVPPVVFRDAKKIVPLAGKLFANKSLTEESFDIVAEIVFHGIKRSAPEMTLDVLLDMPVNIAQMTEAAITVCRQAGLKTKENVPGKQRGRKSPDFEELTAIIVMATGWTWEYIWETMTFQRLEVFMRLWKKTPPANLNLSLIAALLKAFMGVEDKPPSAPPGEDLSTLSDFEE